MIGFLTFFFFLFVALVIYHFVRYSILEPSVQSEATQTDTAQVTPVTEEWRDVPDFPNYEISSLGRIRRRVETYDKWTGKVLKFYPSFNGFPAIGLYRNGERTKLFVHRIVAQVFLGPVPPEHFVHRKNWISTDVRADNLEYRTMDEIIEMGKALGKYNGRRRYELLESAKIKEVSRMIMAGKSDNHISRKTSVSLHRVRDVRNFVTATSNMLAS